MKEGERPLPTPPPTPPLPLHRTMRIVGGEGGLVSPPHYVVEWGKGARGDARGALCAPLGLLSHGPFGPKQFWKGGVPKNPWRPPPPGGLQGGGVRFGGRSVIQSSSTLRAYQIRSVPPSPAPHRQRCWRRYSRAKGMQLPPPHGTPPPPPSSSPASPHWRSQLGDASPPNWLRQWGGGTLRPPPPRKGRAPPTPKPPPHEPPPSRTPPSHHRWEGFQGVMWREPGGGRGDASRALRARTHWRSQWRRERPPPNPPYPPPPSPPYYAYSRWRGRACIPPPTTWWSGGKGARGDARGALCAPLGLLSHGPFGPKQFGKGVPPQNPWRPPPGASKGGFDAGAARAPWHFLVTHLFPLAFLWTYVRALV
nr:hypothetical protein [Morchella crassipes]